MKTRGFTLVETVIVIIILSIVAIVGALVLNRGFHASIQNRDLIEATWQNRLAQQRITDEMRNIRSATSQDLDISSNSQVTFIDVNGEQITYALSGTNLTRNNVTLATGFSALSFTYLNSSLTTTTDVTQVRCINITATNTLNSTTVNSQTMVCPRNLL